MLGVRAADLAGFEAICACHPSQQMVRPRRSVACRQRHSARRHADRPATRRCSRCRAHVARDARRRATASTCADIEGIELDDAAASVLRLRPCSASPSSSRSVIRRRLLPRDPMVGRGRCRWPIARSRSPTSTGMLPESMMAMGERTLALARRRRERAHGGRRGDEPAASGAVALHEAFVGELDGRGRRRWRGCRANDAAAVGMELCPALGVSIPSARIPLSMVRWTGCCRRSARTVSPVSPIVKARTRDVRRAPTPQLRLDEGDSELGWSISVPAPTAGEFGPCCRFRLRGA